MLFRICLLSSNINIRVSTCAIISPDCFLNNSLKMMNSQDANFCFKCYLSFFPLHMQILYIVMSMKETEKA